MCFCLVHRLRPRGRSVCAVGSHVAEVTDGDKRTGRTNVVGEVRTSFTEKELVMLGLQE